LNSSKVRLEYHVADQLGWDQPGPVIQEENLAGDEETLRSLLDRLARRMPLFAETVFNPQTQSLSSEVTIVINGHIQLSQGLETKLQDGDRIIFLPILAGG
jgi:molybdopterin converting factor small subunit